MFNFNINPNTMSLFTANLAASSLGTGGIGGNIGLPGLGSSLGLAPGAGSDLIAQAMLTRLANQFRGDTPNLSQLLDSHNNLPLTPKQLATVLKETLNLPQEFEKTLEQLLLQPEQAKAELSKEKLQQLTNIMTQEIPLETIKTTLKQGADQTQKQLMKLLQSGDPTIANHGSQISKLMAAAGGVGESVLINQNKPVETLILLYLPWYPLVQPRQLDVELGIGQDEEAIAADKAITLYIKTAHLGRFRVQINELKPLEAAIYVWHEAVAKEYCPRLKEAVNEECINKKLAPPKFSSKVIASDKGMVFEPSDKRSESSSETTSTTSSDSPDSASSGFKGATRQADKKQLHIQSNNQSVSGLLLSLAYFMARTIFEADESERTLQQRSKMASNKNTKKEAGVSK